MKPLKSNPFRRYRREPVGPETTTNEGWRTDRRVLVQLQPAHLALLR
jgi:hypothetical protein